MIAINYPDGHISMVHYKEIFRGSPHNYILFAPDAPTFTILDISSAFLRSLGMTREYMVGKGLFEVFPDNPDSEVKNERVLMEHMMRVIAEKEPNKMPIVRYDIPVPGTDKFEVRYWSPENFPLLDAKGDLVLIIHTAVDISAIRKALGF
jgi:PAS domain-containing protein